MAVTLVLPDHIADALDSAARLDVETAGVLIATVVEQDGEVRILGREMHWVSDDAYLRRGETALTIASEGYVRALGRAESMGSMAIWLHTHPGIGARPLPSSHDVVVDAQLADTFRLRTGSPYYGALIISPKKRGVAFSGHLSKASESVRVIDRMWLVGNLLHLENSFREEVPPLPDMFDRNVRAFGEGIQRVLAGLCVGIVGCGGTGSIVIEQLVRLGLRKFVLFDPDTLTASNVTRVYGSTPADIGRRKVDVLGDHIERIAPDAETQRLFQAITAEQVARRLALCDIVFGCTDDNAGRLILSRASTYLLIPVIDCGVLLTSAPDGTLIGVDGRVTVMVPGQACLICRGRIDLARAAAEMLTPQERVKREDEGYAPALGRTEPAVVSFTSGVGVTAVNEMLERLVGFGADPRPSEILVRFHERELSSNIALPREKHYCDPNAQKFGTGFSSPLFDIAWTS